MAMARQVAHQPRFNDRAVVYASMFEDSLAPTWTPGDLFRFENGARLVAPYARGYLVEMDTRAIERFAVFVANFGTIRDQVDISRVESVRFFTSKDVLSDRTIEALWEQAPRRENGRAFFASLMPLRDQYAVEHLLQAFAGLRDGTILPPSRQLMLDLAVEAETGGDTALARAVRAISGTDRIGRALRDYRLHQRARTTVIVESPEALQRVAASGAVMRLDPVLPITVADPGEGREPDRPLPANLSGLPIVGVVDGGLNASSYFPAEAWRAPPLVHGPAAEVMHGNRVTSIVVQGHEWNNNLVLPALHCRVGTVPAIAKRGHPGPDQEELIEYLDAVMTAHPETKVWNLSFNQDLACEVDAVSYLGHALSMLARKHGVLLVNSIGNAPGDCAKRPADCEAALTVGGRLHDAAGRPGDSCTVSLSGPGPCGMLKPDISHFSHVRALGGAIISGSSFATALASPLAAHTMDRLREPDPDLVRALLIHTADGEGFDVAKGFGTPDLVTLPWECRPGTVTLQWKASLRDRASYYWELPIPPALLKDGRLRGKGRLTAVLNPHPMVDEFAGPNYFSARLNTAVQYPKGDKFANLLGSMDTDKVPEAIARAVDHKWCTVRNHAKDFSTRGYKVDGNVLRIYARIYTRDHYVYGLSPDEVSPLDAVFVLSLSGSDERDDVYNQLRDQLGSFVETAVVESDIDIDHLGG
ncbi:S8 family peptidase [Sphingobium tyrosinilyticum]|uniref:S8 family peptidase n=1 Tax=Sphingobium tyrosinilyticum TaxID=2715436 RepID=A0ABV9EW69_9SPHN